MTEQYTPTTEQVRLDYVMAYSEKESSQILAERDFDRWLAEARREAAEEARRIDHEKMKRLLELQFGSFLAHQPFDPEKFWGQPAREICEAIERGELS